VLDQRRGRDRSDAKRWLGGNAPRGW